MKVQTLSIKITCLFLLNFLLFVHGNSSKIVCKPNTTLSCDWDAHLTKTNFSSSWMAAVGNMPSSLLPTIVGSYPSHALQFRDVGTLSSCNIGTFTRHFRINGEPNVTCSMQITFSGSSTTPVLEWPIDMHIWYSPTLTEFDVLENTVRARRKDQNGGCGPTGTNLINNTATNNPITTNGYTPEFGPLEESLRGQPRFNNKYKNVGCNVFGRKIVISQYTATDACRKWVVSFQNINWCTNTSAGCRETVYKYKSNDAPMITHCDAPKVKFLNNNCVGETELKPKATSNSGNGSDLTWRVKIYIDNPNFTGTTSATYEYSSVGGVGGSSAITGPNPTIYLTGSRALPPGTHGVKYIVSNGCGAVKECDTSIVVWAKLPTPICINIATAVMKNGKVDLWAKHFDFKSVGYCGTKYLVFTFNNERPVQSKIKLQHYFKGNGINATKAEYDEGLAQIWIPEISIRQRPNMPNGEPDWRGPDTTLIGGQSGMAFGCKVGDGSSFPESNIKMTVWDDKWNSEFCAVKVSFVDNQNACTPPPPPAPKDSFVILAGSIYYPNGSMFPAVKVKLSASLPEFPIIESSDTVGGYVFEQLPTQKNYKITASYQSDFLDGVNNGDMMVLLKHVLDIEPITSKSKLIAADINGDGIVEVDDLRLLMQALMGAIDVSKMESYRFVDKKQFDMDSIWPINYHITHDSLMENVLDNDLVAIKIGDLEAVKEPEERQLVFRSASNLDLIVEDKYVKTGDVIDIPFILDQNLSFEGLQAAISLSNFDMLQVESNVFGIKSSDFTIQDDVLKLVLIDVVSSSASAGDQVIHLKLKARKDGKLSNLLQLAANIMDPIVFSGANMEERTLQLKFVNSSDKISSLMNAPNPWSDKTAIYFNAQREGNAQVSIFDLSGRTILERTISVSQGDNVLEISNDQMSNVQGLLIYKLAIGQDVKVGKMMKVE